MPGFQIDPDSIDFDHLPPLVKRGDDREKVIADLIERWCEPVTDVELARYALFGDSELEFPGYVLDGVDFWDENTQSPINLIELLHAAAKLVRSKHGEAPKLFVPDVFIGIRGCRVRQCKRDDRTLLDLPASLVVQSSKFDEDASFNLASIGGGAWFGSARIGGHARFDSARIGGDVCFDSAGIRGRASFRSARIGGGASLDSAHIGGDAKFDSARIGGRASFRSARIWGGANFDSARIGGDARFGSARIGGDARFDSARIGGDAWFDSARIGGHAWFDSARIGGDARFGSARIGGVASFVTARIGGDARFDSARIGGSVDASNSIASNGWRWSSGRFSDARFTGTSTAQMMQFHTDSRDAAEFGAHAPARWRARAAWRLWRWRDAYLHWKNVRGLGELAILARASMLMLVLVPVLAGLWPAIQSAVQRYAAARWHDGLATRAVRALVGGYDMPTVKGGPFLSHTMPWAFGALFFAALFVVLGRVLYQMHVPDLIRSRSRYEFGLDEKEDIRKHGSVEEEQRLQESIDAIAEAGSDQALRWFRHPNLVRRLNRTVWVPHTVQMFRAPTIKAIDTRMFTHGFDEGWVFKEDEEAELNLDECESQDVSKAGEGTWVGVPQPIMAESSRKQIVMEAGADARYDLAGRQNIGWARTALWCYVLAVIAVVLVVWAQSVDVLIGMGLDIVAYLLVQLLVWGPWIILTAILVWVCIDLFRASRGLPRERPHWMPEDRWNNLHELDAELARDWAKDP